MVPPQYNEGTWNLVYGVFVTIIYERIVKPVQCTESKPKPPALYHNRKERWCMLTIWQKQTCCKLYFLCSEDSYSSMKLVFPFEVCKVLYFLSEVKRTLKV